MSSAYGLAPLFLIRMAGVPFESVGDLATGESSALARRLIAAEHARDEIIARLRATFELGERPFSDATYRALRKAIRTQSPPERVPGEQPPLFHEYARAAGEIATLEREMEQHLKSEIELARANLLGSSRRFLPRYLVFGSSAMRTAVDKMWDPLESTCRHASLSIL